MFATRDLTKLKWAPNIQDKTEDMIESLDKESKDKSQVMPHYLTNTYIQLGTLKIYIDCNGKDNGKSVASN